MTKADALPSSPAASAGREPAAAARGAEAGLPRDVSATKPARASAGLRAGSDAARARALPWPESMMEAAHLGTFMIAACLFGALLEHPASPVRQALPDPFVRRLLMGLAMGSTAVSIVLSPWGRRSGAHFNPAVTLTFWRLGKVRGRDALLYIAAHFAGGAAGVGLAALLVRSLLAHPSVNWVATLPGPGGARAAFAAEAAISFVLMATILIVSNSARLGRYTPYFAGSLVALYIAFEAPISGMSMNPARTFASATAAGGWETFWIYLLAPAAGMLLAAEAYVAARGARAVHCAKLHHHNDAPCIFDCNFGELLRRSS